MAEESNVVLGVGAAAPALPDPLAPTLQNQVREYILDLIRSGKRKPGDRLPTEVELQKQFGVSRITVRNAVTELSLRGVVVRKAALGTFVAQPKIEQELGRLTGFVEDMHAMGMQASARVAKIASIKADDHIASRLNLVPGSPITYIERVRLGNDEPLSFDCTYLPAHIGERVARENLEAKPIFSLLEDQYGIPLREAEYVIEATLASRHVARHLEMQAGMPVLLIERTTYSRDGDPIDYEKLHYKGDRMRYRMRVVR
jgi:GntR family transcriptional regulator